MICKSNVPTKIVWNIVKSNVKKCISSIKFDIKQHELINSTVCIITEQENKHFIPTTELEIAQQKLIDELINSRILSKPEHSPLTPWTNDEIKGIRETAKKNYNHELVGDIEKEATAVV